MGISGALQCPSVVMYVLAARGLKDNIAAKVAEIILGDSSETVTRIIKHKIHQPSEPPHQKVGGIFPFFTSRSWRQIAAKAFASALVNHRSSNGMTCNLIISPSSRTP